MPDDGNNDGTGAEGTEGQGQDLDAEGQDTGDDRGGDDGDDKPLGERGERALQAEKDKRKAAQRELRAFKDLGLTPEQIRELTAGKSGDGDDGKKKDDAPDAEQLRRDAERDALAKANGRIIRSEVKAAAAGKLADPSDALRLLDLEQFEVDDDGNVNEQDIADEIDDLLKKKPYLAAQGGKRFQGGADAGARGKPSKPDPGPGLARLRAAYSAKAS